MAEEGFSFDPSKKTISEPIRAVKTSSKNFDLSLDDIISQQRQERIEERKNQNQERGDNRLIGRRRSYQGRPIASRVSQNSRSSRNTRSPQQGRRGSVDNERRRSRGDNEEQDKPRKVSQKAKPRQIEVDEESLRKFLRGEGIKMDKNFTYKIMSYPKE